jgi:hypothetical protein
VKAPVGVVAPEALVIGVAVDDGCVLVAAGDAEVLAPLLLALTFVLLDVSLLHPVKSVIALKSVIAVNAAKRILIFDLLVWKASRFVSRNRPLIKSIKACP